MKNIIKKIITSAFVLVFAALLANHAFAIDGWTAEVGSGQRNWTAITSNASGTIVFASDGNYIFKSVDGGINWVQTSAPYNTYYIDLKLSANENKLAAVAYGGYIYTSDDLGNTWNEQTSAGIKAWKSIALSADGTKIASVNSNGYVYISDNSGVDWATSTASPILFWESIVMLSTDGQKMAAVNSGNQGQIYITEDGGVTWATSSAPYAWYTSISASSDFTKVVAVGINNSIYRSSDGGETWTNINIMLNKRYVSVSSSADGESIAVVEDINGYIYTSSDGGANWSTSTEVGIGNWRSIKYSSDGTKLLAAAYNGYIYRYGALNSPVVTVIQPAMIIDNTSLRFNSFVNTEHTVHGFEWCDGGTVSINTGCTYNASTTYNGTFGLGIYNATVTSLLNNHFYHYRAFATNDVGTSYSQDNAVLLNYEAWTEELDSPIGGVYWDKIKTNSTGDIILAKPAYSNYIVRSTDRGITWSTSTASVTEFSLSSDGTKILGMTDSYLYTSIDGGYTWTQRIGGGNRIWMDVSSSDDGVKLVAAAEFHYGSGSYIYISSNSGVTWSTSTAPQKNWTSIDSSANGDILIASAINDYVYVSLNGGSTWTQTSLPQKNTWFVASSADGTKLTATASGDYIYTSTDSGSTWTQQTLSGQRSWSSLASSADGNKLIGIAQNDYVYVSLNAGVNWTQQNIPISSSGKVALSDSGEFMISGGANTRLWTYYNSMPEAGNVEILEQ